MDNSIHDRIDVLTRQIQQLARKQSEISSELVQLMNELDALKRTVNTTTVTSNPVEQQQSPAVKTVTTPPTPPAPARVAPPRASASFEEFIGKNIASKVGILVTIIGIFIGAKYAIEHDMVSPALRILVGYICGAALVGVAIKLKKKYEAYSSVLMGGGLAVLYFITYIAYSFYELMPQGMAFGMMLVFTAVTVYAALWYNRVIIAHLAQIGAYAIPFLLSDNSGRYAVFFSYVAIINTGILAVSLRKYWKSLFYAAFILTWIIYNSWYFFSYHQWQHEAIAWTFLIINFLIFYATFLAYKIIKKEQYSLSDVAVLLSNAFIFYGIGFGLLHDKQPHNYTGLFTLINAAIHLVVSQVIRKLKLADRSLYYLVLGLVIVFCTIAVPVQFDGSWVTLLWTAEAVLVFMIGRTRKTAAYEKLGAGLIVLSFLSMIHEWYGHSMDFSFGTDVHLHPFLNISFVTGLLVAAAQGTIVYVSRSRKYETLLPSGSIYRIVYDYVVPVLFLITWYVVFQIEINGYFSQLKESPSITSLNYGLWYSEVNSMAFISILLYTMVFDIAVMYSNSRWVKNKALGAGSLVIMGLLLFVLLVQGLAVLNGRAHEFYVHPNAAAHFGALNVWVRYVVMVITAALLYFGQKTVREFLTIPGMYPAWQLVAHTITLGFISAEYLCWTTISGSDSQYKLGLSIVWGIYALAMIVIGINKKQKHVRLGAIVLFVITLVKLFVYDLAGAGTITKTISFISLGVILLLVSFLYNKYKEVLFGNDEEK